MTAYARNGWLVQESLPTRWHILVAAILLNQSRRSLSWDRTLDALFETYPCPTTLAGSGSELEELLKPHGFQNVKAKRLRKMSEQYLTWDHQDPRELYGCGEYAYDSFRIFVWGERPEFVRDGALAEFLEREKLS